MSLGSNIQRLRKEHNMSQGDLADALGISRQSVSKWETDTATPDLDKLLKISKIFDISLDELVKGDEATTTPFVENTKQDFIPVTVKTGLETRQIAGIILLCMAFLVVLVCTIIGGFLVGFVLCIPFLICGLICMFARKHVGIWCGWAINILLIIYLHLATGSSYAMIFNPYVYVYANPIALIVSWIHFIFIATLIFFTVRAFRTLSIDWNQQKQTSLIAVWIVYLLLHAPYVKLFTGVSLPVMKLLIYINVFLGIARMILLTALIIFTLNWYQWRKAKHPPS